MPIVIKRVSSKKEIKAFVGFQNELYRGNEYFVPKIFDDECNTLDERKNPAFKFCDVAIFLAYKEDRIVGRVAAIINHRANERWNHKEVRFGWIDFIDDEEVSKALIDTVADFGRQHGMEKIVGPLGFTDFDPEGMLVEGFDQLCTMVLIYNHPYYPEHLEKMGFTKEVDWLEFKLFVPGTVPEKVSRVAAIASEKYNLHVRKFNRRQLMKEDLGHKIFDLINETYGELYNFTLLPEDLIDKYIRSYIGVLNLKYVTLVEDEDNQIIGFGITLPSIVRALQKCGGKLFPFGWFHVLKSLYIKHEEVLELMLIGVKAEYRSRGVMAMIFNDLIPRYIKGGFRYAETNAELEDNIKVQAPWEMFDYKQTKRRRIYGKPL